MLFRLLGTLKKSKTVRRCHRKHFLGIYNRTKNVFEFLPCEYTLGGRIDMINIDSTMERPMVSCFRSQHLEIYIYIRTNYEPPPFVLLCAPI